MAISNLCRFSEVAWVTVLGTYYGASVLFLLFTLIGHVLPIHFKTPEFRFFLPLVVLVLGSAVVTGMLWLGQEFYCNNPAAITLARILIFIGILYSLLAVGANVWFFYIHAHASSVLYLIKSMSMLVGNVILFLYFIKAHELKKLLV